MHVAYITPHSLISTVSLSRCNKNAKHTPADAINKITMDRDVTLAVLECDRNTISAISGSHGWSCFKNNYIVEKTYINVGKKNLNINIYARIRVESQSTPMILSRLATILHRQTRTIAHCKE